MPPPALLVLSLAARAEMRAAIHSETSDFTNAMRLSPSGTAAGKRPSARYLFNIVRDSEVSSQARFIETRQGSSEGGFMVGILWDSRFGLFSRVTDACRQKDRSRLPLPRVQNALRPRFTHYTY